MCCSLKPEKIYSQVYLPSVFVELKSLIGGEKVEGKLLKDIYFVVTIKAVPERKKNQL